jgi:hypothetical protein
MARILPILILILISIGLSLPSWCFVVAAFAYAFRFDPYVPIVCAVLIDAHFGSLEAVYPYVYTSYTIGVVVLARFLRPRFSV